MADKKMSSHQARLFLKELMNGCGNHACIVKKRVGQGTNASCNCHMKIVDGVTNQLVSDLEAANMTRDIFRIEKELYQFKNQQYREAMEKHIKICAYRKMGQSCECLEWEKLLPQPDSTDKENELCKYCGFHVCQCL